MSADRLRKMMERKPTEEERSLARLRVAMSSLPFGADYRIPKAPGRYTFEPITTAFMAEYLEKLGEVLREHVAECRARDERLVQLESDVRAVGRLIGEAQRMVRS